MRRLEAIACAPGEVPWRKAEETRSGEGSLSGTVAAHKVVAGIAGVGGSGTTTRRVGVAPAKWQN